MILHSHDWYFSNKQTDYEFWQGEIIFLFASVGGFSQSVMFIFGMLGLATNNRKVIAKHIRNLYFVNDTIHNSNEPQNTNVYDRICSIKFIQFEKWTNIKFICCRSKNRLKNKTLIIGEEKLKNESSVIRILQTI